MPLRRNRARGPARVFLPPRATARRLAHLTTILLILVATGCAANRSDVDLDKARQFDRFPLYWVGERFEKWDLTTIDGLDYPSYFVTFVYGNCEPRDGEQPSCSPPLQIQLSPLCQHLDVVSESPIWKRRRVRGAPLGQNPDGAPVLLSRAAQVKVYRGKGSDPGVPLRALRALRSINDVRPLISPTGRIPAPMSGVLDGRQKCRAH